jgi:hypothetical protein
VGAERGGKKWVLGVAFPRKGPSRSVEVRETGRVQMMSAQEAEEYSAQLRSYRDGDNEMGTGDGDTTRTTTGLRWMSTQGGLCQESATMAGSKAREALFMSCVVLGLYSGQCVVKTREC